jgi:hypothetical protein
MKKTPFHPYLFGLFPIFFLFSQNIGQGEVQFIDIIVPSLVILCFAFIFSVFFSAILKEKHAGAILSSIFLLYLLSYGHGYAVLNKYFNVQHRFLLIESLALLFLSAYLIVRKKKKMAKATGLLNIFAVSLLLVPLGAMSLCAARCFIQGRNCRAIDHDESFLVTAPAANKPDIYYIVIDSYAGGRTLQEALNYDNREFTGFLRKRGFRIAQESRSNYSSTFLSLASSLNMEYINYLTEVIGAANEPYILQDMIRNNKLIKILKGKGYRVLHFGMWMRSGEEERKLGFDMRRSKYFSAFSLGLMEETILKIFYDYYFASVIKNVTYDTLEAVARVPRLNGPSFTFAYFYGLHVPFVFGPEGQEIDPYTAVENAKHRENFNKLYLDQLRFYNSRISQLIDDILLRSRIPPIIVLQSDHGEQFFECSQQDFIPCIQQRMRNFNAYYLPDNGAALLYDSITPVNSFRLILKRYFNAQVDLLEDRCFYSDRRKPFIFSDVTEPEKKP